MTRPTSPIRARAIFAAFAACLLMSGPWAGPLRADDVKLKAVFGLAGRYRPGTWCPVTVTVQNPGTDAVSGQLQVLAANDPGRQNSRMPGANQALTTALFARPVSLPGGSGSAVVYARGIDPGRDEVTVQLTEGHARGDGRLLAQVTNQTSNQTSSAPPAITGTPVGDTDLLLVGFGGEQGAFTYLSGQKLALMHQSAGGVAQYGSGSGNGFTPPAGQTNGMAPPTAQIADAAASDLPDKAAGYSGVDAFLLRSDAPLDALTESQTDALRGWVAAGGHLIVCGGVDPSRFGSSFFAGLLPATVGAARPSVSVPGAGPVGALTLVPKPLPGVRVLAGDAGTGPLIVSGPYGAGRVTFLAYDPTTKAFQSPAFNTGALWQTLLTAGHATPSSVLGFVAAREENYSSSPYAYYNNNQTLLSDAVMRAPSLDAPGTEVIGLFLLVYLVVLVPLNYLVLKRLDRKELAWVTIPGLVLVFALGTFGVGYAAKGGAVFLNRASVLETTSGQHDAGIYSEVGLFSPHRTSYDITLPGANALAAIPNPGLTFGNQGNSADTQSYGQTRFVETGEGAALQDASVNMWAMRAFDAQATTDLGGSVDATLGQKPGPLLPRGLVSWGVEGTVHNRTPYDLSECSILYNGQWQDLGDLAHGANAAVSIATPTAKGGQGGLQIPTLRGRVDKDDSQSDIRQRMRAALAEYVRSLGQAQNNNYYGGQAQAPAVFTQPSNEALLLGWSSDPALAGPQPRVDGHPVRENDVTLVVVHLPVNPIQVTN